MKPNAMGVTSRQWDGDFSDIESGRIFRIFSRKLKIDLEPLVDKHALELLIHFEIDGVFAEGPMKQGIYKVEIRQKAVFIGVNVRREDYAVEDVFRSFLKGTCTQLSDILETRYVKLKDVDSRKVFLFELTEYFRNSNTLLGF